MRGMGRSPVAAVAAGVMAVALAGCWPAPGQGPGRQSHNPFESTITVDSVATLDEDWSVDLGDGWTGAPIVSPSGVHAANGAVLHTLDRADGDAVWDFDPGLPAEVGQMGDPVWQDGEVFVGYGFGNAGGQWDAQSLDAATGEPARTLGGGLVDSLRGTALVQAYAGFGSGTPVAIWLAVQADLDDPATRWGGLMHVTSGPGGGGPRAPASAGTAGVYHAGVGPTSMTPSQSPPSGNGIRMFTYEQPANCYTGTGSIVVPCPTWFTDLDGSASTSPVIGPDEQTLYVGTNAGTVYALDAATGAVQWSAAVGAAVNASPALAGSNLFVPTGDGDLVALAADGCGAATCEPLWTAPAGNNLMVQPAVAGGVVFTGATDGSVRGFPAAGCGAATCEPLWSASTGSRITGAPAVSGGRLYVGTADGRLLAYAPSG